MGFDTKSLKNRIKSVDSTLHLTKAMGLVASTKIRGATNAMLKSREYAGEMEATIDMLSASKICEKSEYMKKGASNNICIIVIAGDRGLAGGYNSNIFRMVEETKYSEIIPIGKRSCDRYTKDLMKTEGFSYSEAIELAKKVCDDFKEGKYEKVGIISTKYISMMTQVPETKWILPLEKKSHNLKSDIIFEPDEKTILEAVIEEYIASKILEAVRESFTCEVVARRFAMDSAGKNAGEMIENLTLEYNRARQSAITQEITEIVAGSGM